MNFSEATRLVILSIKVKLLFTYAIYFSLIQISRYSKMEKADILEMAVQFLKGTQARQRMQPGWLSKPFWL